MVVKTLPFTADQLEKALVQGGHHRLCDHRELRDTHDKCEACGGHHPNPEVDPSAPKGFQQGEKQQAYRCRTCDLVQRKKCEACGKATFPYETRFFIGSHIFKCFRCGSSPVCCPCKRRKKKA